MLILECPKCLQVMIDTFSNGRHQTFYCKDCGIEIGLSVIETGNFLTIYYAEANIINVAQKDVCNNFLNIIDEWNERS